MATDRIGSPADRFARSATRLPDPVELSADSGRPIPGQQALALAAAGYREAAHVSTLTPALDTPSYP